MTLTTTMQRVLEYATDITAERAQAASQDAALSIYQAIYSATELTWNDVAYPFLLEEAVYKLLDITAREMYGLSFANLDKDPHIHVINTHWKCVKVMRSVIPNVEAQAEILAECESRHAEYWRELLAS